MCCHGSAWVYVMTADNHVSRPRKPSDWRGATEVSAGRTGVGGLVAGWVGQEIQRERMCFVMLRYIENSLCKFRLYKSFHCDSNSDLEMPDVDYKQYAYLACVYVVCVCDVW